TSWLGVPKAEVAHVAYGTISDRLIDRVRRRICQVCVETAERTALVEETLCQVGDTCGGISTSPILWWRENKINANAALRTSRPPRHGDRASIVPDEHASLADTIPCDLMRVGSLADVGLFKKGCCPRPDRWKICFLRRTEYSGRS